MSKPELTFEQAWEYLRFLVELGFNKVQIAEYIGCDRVTVSNVMNGVIERKTGNPKKLPKKFHDKVIELVNYLQLEAWRKRKKEKT